VIKKLFYWKRIFSTYLIQNKSNLSFWHGEPVVNQYADYSRLDKYYMKFHYKANYNGNYDQKGIPLLNYHGDIGLQYNPIAIAQWALGNYNLHKHNNDEHYKKFIRGANWLNQNIEANIQGVSVWQHHFNWTYKEDLVNPWYSGLAQGQGLSVLCRAYKETKNDKYLQTIKKVYKSFLKNIHQGGVTFTDQNGDIWIEEYIMKKNPTHILNGFIWGLWGIYDYWLLTNEKESKKLFDKYIKTLEKNIDRYDLRDWSLYELSNLKIDMRASFFYHKLHIVQLKILYNMTSISIFNDKALQWENYLLNKFNVIKATIMKIIFKLTYY